MKQKLLLLLGCLAWSGTIGAVPLGTLFTYQGRLDQNSRPSTNGLYGMSFALYAVADGGFFIATNLLAVPVTNGLFTASLDFGMTAFSGDARWLEIGVNTNTVSPTPGYLTLLPRARLTPTPNAIYASIAGTVAYRAIQTGQLGTVSAPLPGQVLGYNGTSLAWQTAGIGSSPWLMNGADTYFSGGNVGIGTTVPSAPLHVSSDAMASSVLAALLEPNLDNGAFNQIYLGRSPVGNGCSTFTYTYDATNPGFSLLSLGLYNSSFTLNLRGNGYVGIGTTSPTEKLHVAGAYLRVEGTGGEAAYLGGDGLGADVQVGSLNPNVSEVVLWNAGANSHMNLTANHAGFYGNLECRGIFAMRGSRTYVSGFDGAGFHWLTAGSDAETIMGFKRVAANNYELHTQGKLITPVLQITGGADLAEPFPMKEEEIENGSVVVIDEENPGRLKRSTRAYDTRVAGIVSGANGIHPGISLQQEGALDQGKNVALTGRVYVKADASHGAINAGDLLTTSDTPGHAMKVSDHAKSQGAILGKAMSALQEGTGLVLVLVTLQ